MKVLVGVDGASGRWTRCGSEPGSPAVEGGELVVAHVYPRDPTYGSEPRFARDLRRHAEELLERLHGELPDLQFEDRLVEESRA